MRAVLGEVIRISGLLATMLLIVVLLDGVFATLAAATARALGGAAQQMAGAALQVGFLALAGPMLAALLVAYALDRRFPSRPVAALRQIAHALGLAVLLDVPRLFATGGIYAGRAVRLHCMAMPMLTGHRVTVGVAARTGGYGLLSWSWLRGLQVEGRNRDWLKAIQDDPEGARALAALAGPGASVALLPGQVHVTGRIGLSSSPDSVREHLMAALELAEVAERHTPSSSGATASLQLMEAFLPDPAGSTLLFDLFRGLRIATLCGLVAITALSLLLGVVSAVLLPWVASELG